MCVYTIDIVLHVTLLHYDIYSWPLDNTGIGTLTPNAVENLHLIIVSATYTFPVCLRFYILGSNQSPSFSTIAFTVEENPPISGPVQFKPTLFYCAGLLSMSVQIHSVLFSSCELLHYIGVHHLADVYCWSIICQALFQTLRTPHGTKQNPCPQNNHILQTEELIWINSTYECHSLSHF